MKHVFLFCALVFCTYSYAFQTVLTSSIYVNEETGPSYTPGLTDIPMTIKRVQFINRVTSCPEMETALTAAEYIFSAAMNAENLDLVPIVAEVIYGDYLDFWDPDELCQVSVTYTDTIIRNSYYNNIGKYEYNDLPTLIPMTMYNQCKGTSSGPTIQIKLNPYIPYHYDISNVPLDKCDAITVFLRALVMGCGVHSTLTLNPVQFGITNNGQTYINAFDSNIQNDLGVTFGDVACGNVTAEDFLGSQIIKAIGCKSKEAYDTVHIKLFNDWEWGVDMLGPLTPRTLNTISADAYTDSERESDFHDLLGAELGYGMEQRTVSHYTMALLRGLGWEKTIPVGYNDYIDNSTLQCNERILRPNQTYSVWLSGNLSLSDLVCELASVDSSYAVGSCFNNSFSYQSIPNNIQWKRNPITKNIVGNFQCKATALIDDRYIEKEKKCAIEIPFRPNKPIVQKSESASNGFLTLDLKAFANGSDTYTITYTGVTNGDTHTITVTANALDTILSNIPANQLYNLSIYGTNNEGNSDTYNFTFGTTALPVLKLSVSVRGTNLIYNLYSTEATSQPHIVINSVKITTTQGEVVMTSQAGMGEPIDISSLARGNYIFAVVANGTTYSKIFIK